MHYLKSLLLFSIIAITAIILSSCQESPTTATNDNPVSPSLSKFTLPSDATINDATLYIYALTPKGNTVYAHNLTADWEECSVTWNTFNQQYDPTVVGSFLNDTIAGWKSVDITSLVSGWVDGSITNYGVLLKEECSDPDYNYERSQYDSKENTNAPYLLIHYTDGTGSHEVSDIPLEDVFIWQLYPDSNFCSSDLLYTGTRNTECHQQKYSMLKFEFETPPPSGGCTLTPGYWQTHSSYGPAPYDDTWALLPGGLGADTQFFTTGKTYYETLWTSPAGNAYYILSFQYIAAQLNFLHGADPTDAQAAFNTATTLFNTYTPAQIGAMRGNNPVRQQFVSLASTLDNYNNGYIGPGHYDD